MSKRQSKNIRERKFDTFSNFWDKRISIALLHTIFEDFINDVII